MSSPYTVHPMEAVFRAGEIERAAQDRKIAELWKAVQGEQHDDSLDYFRRGFFLGSNYQKEQLASEASPLGHAAIEAECVAKCLDDAGTPKTDGGKELSLWGRVVRYAASAPVPAGVQGDAARQPLTTKEIADLTAMVWGAPVADNDLKLAEFVIRAHEEILKTGERPKDPVDGGRYIEVPGAFGEGT